MEGWKPSLPNWLQLPSDPLAECGHASDHRQDHRRTSQLSQPRLQNCEQIKRFKPVSFGVVVAQSEATNVPSQGLDLLIRKRLLWVELCPPLKKDMLEAPEPMNMVFLGGGVE